MLGKQEDNYPAYKIEKGQSKRTCTNDSFRIMYPVDLLIELSPMGGNPIGPYGDKDGNYRRTMESNIKAFKSSMKVFEISKMLTKEMNISFMKLQKNKEKISTYDVIDMIYEEFYKKVNKMKSDINERNER